MDPDETGEVSVTTATTKRRQHPLASPGPGPGSGAVASSESSGQPSTTTTTSLPSDQNRDPSQLSTSRLPPQRASIKICDLNPSITCVICTGYLISAVTIVECLHSFCRSCIIKFLDDNPQKACPICDAPLHKTKPILSLRPDKTLQDIVYKLVPGLYARELNQRKRFYFSAGLENGHLNGGHEDEDDMLVEHENGAAHFYDPDEKISLSLEYALGHNQDVKFSSDAPPPPTSVASPPEEDDSACQRRYLLCPAAMTVTHLRKFIYNKYRLSDKQYSVDIIYQDDNLDDHLKLMDIAYIFSWRRVTPMRLFYRIGKRKMPRQPLKLGNKEVPTKLAKVSPRVQDPQPQSSLAPKNSLASDSVSSPAAQVHSSSSTTTSLSQPKEQKLIPITEKAPKTSDASPTKDQQVKSSTPQRQPTASQKPKPVPTIYPSYPPSPVVVQEKSITKPPPKGGAAAAVTTMKSSPALVLPSKPPVTIPSSPPKPTKESISVQCNIKSSSLPSLSSTATTTSALRNIRIGHNRGGISTASNNASNSCTTSSAIVEKCKEEIKRSAIVGNIPNQDAATTSTGGSSNLKRKSSDSSAPAVQSVKNITHEGNGPVKSNGSDSEKSQNSTKFHMRNILGSSSPPPHFSPSLATASQPQGGKPPPHNHHQEKLHVVPTPKGVTIVRETAMIGSGGGGGVTQPNKNTVGTQASHPSKAPKVSSGTSTTTAKNIKREDPRTPSPASKVMQTTLKPSAASLRAFQHYFTDRKQSATATSDVNRKPMSATEKVQLFLNTSSPATPSPPPPAPETCKMTTSSSSSPQIIKTYRPGPLSKTQGNQNPASGSSAGKSLDRIVAKIINKNGPSPMSPKSPMSPSSKKDFAAMSPKNVVQTTGTSTETDKAGNPLSGVVSPTSPRSPGQAGLSSPKPNSTGNLILRISTKGKDMICTTTSPVLRSPGSASPRAPSLSVVSSPKAMSPRNPPTSSMKSPSHSHNKSNSQSPSRGGGGEAGNSPKYQYQINSPVHVPQIKSPRREQPPPPPPPLSIEPEAPAVPPQVVENIIEKSEEHVENVESQMPEIVLHESEPDSDDEGQLVVDIAADESQSSLCSQTGHTNEGDEEDEEEQEEDGEIEEGELVDADEGSVPPTTTATPTNTTATPTSNSEGRPTSETPTSQISIPNEIAGGAEDPNVGDTGSRHEDEDIVTVEDESLQSSPAVKMTTTAVSDPVTTN